MRNNKIAASIKLSLAFDFAKFRARSLKFYRESNHVHKLGSLKANNYKYGDDASFEVISDEFNVHIEYMGYLGKTFFL
jgi:hypothetical protein